MGFEITVNSASQNSDATEGPSVRIKSTAESVQAFLDDKGATAGECVLIANDRFTLFCTLDDRHDVRVVTCHGRTAKASLAGSFFADEEKQASSKCVTTREHPSLPPMDLLFSLPKLPDVIRTLASQLESDGELLTDFLVHPIPSKVAIPGIGVYEIQPALEVNAK